MDLKAYISANVDLFLDDVITQLERPYEQGLSVVLNQPKVFAEALEAMLYQALLRHRDNRDGTLLYSADSNTGRPFLKTVKKRLKTAKAGLSKDPEVLFAYIDQDLNFMDGFLGLTAEQTAFCAAILKVELQKYKDNPPKRGWKMEPRIYIDPDHKGPEEEGIFYKISLVFLWLALHLGLLGALVVVTFVVVVVVFGGLIFGLVELYNLIYGTDFDLIEHIRKDFFN